MKNFGDVFQLSQGSGGMTCILAAVLCYKTRGIDCHRALRRSAVSLNLIFGGVKTQAMEYVIAAIVGAVCLGLGMLLGWNRRKSTAEREIGSAEEEATRIVNEAYKSAESKKREALVEAKEEILKARNEFDKEVKERRSELSRQERRVQSKEESLDKKTENLEKKDEALQKKIQENELLAEDLQKLGGQKGVDSFQHGGILLWCSLFFFC